MSKLDTEKGFKGIETLRKCNVHGVSRRAAGDDIATVQDQILKSMGRYMTAELAMRSI